MSEKKTYFLRIIVGVLFVLSGPVYSLSAINLSYFEEAHFIDGTVGKANIDIAEAINQNPNAIKRHLQGLKYWFLGKTTEDPSQRAIILWAATNNRLDALEAILTIAKTDPHLNDDLERAVNFKDPVTGNTPLHEAVLKGNSDMVKILLDKANQFLVNNKGNSPLHEAVIKEELEIVKMLVEATQQENRSKFVEVKNKENKTALELAPKNSDLEKYLNKIVNPAKIEEKKKEKKDEEAKRLAEEKRLADEEAKKNKIDIQDNQLEGKLEKLSESLGKLKSKLGALKNSLGLLKENLDEKSGSLAMDSSEELAKKEAYKKEQEKLKPGVKFNQIPATKILDVPRKVGGATGRKLPTRGKAHLERLKYQEVKNPAVTIDSVLEAQEKEQKRLADEKKRADEELKRLEEIELLNEQIKDKTGELKKIKKEIKQMAVATEFTQGAKQVRIKKLAKTHDLLKELSSLRDKLKKLE